MTVLNALFRPRAKRSRPGASRRRGRLIRRNGVSPTVQVKTGPGTGVASAKRFARASKRRLKRRTQLVAIRKIERPGSPWRYEIYFKCDRLTDDLYAQHLAAIDFIRSSCSGAYKIVRVKDEFRKRRPVNYVKLVEESDLFMFMLCHSDVVRKVFEIENNEAPRGL